MSGDDVASDLDIAWAAGFLDGEGTFGITRNNVIYYNIYVSAPQEMRAPLDKLQWLFGGTVYDPYERSTSFGRSPLYTYSATGPTAGNLTEAVYPYLMVKKMEAAFILQYKALGYVPVGGRLTTDLLRQRSILYEQFRGAKRGR